MTRVRRAHRREKGERGELKRGHVVRFTTPTGPTLGVITSLSHGVHVQHLISTHLGLMRHHRRCSSPSGPLTRVAVRAPRWVHERGVFRTPLSVCDSCTHRRRAKRARTVVVTEDGIEYAGEAWHVGDLVGFRSEEKGQPWEMGLVRRLGESVTVQLCERGGWEVSYASALS